MNETAQKGNILAAILIGGALISLVTLSIWYFWQPQKYTHEFQDLNMPLNPATSNGLQNFETTDSGKQTNKHYSKTMNITFSIPPGFKVDEKNNFIKLINEEKELLVSKDATQYYNVDDHLKNLVSKNNLTISNKSTVSIDDKTGIEVTLNSSVYKEKVYLIYHEDFIYTFSTKNALLYEELNSFATSVKFEK